MAWCFAAPGAQDQVVVAVEDHLRRMVGTRCVTLGRVSPLRVVVAEDDDRLAELIESLLREDASVSPGRAGSNRRRGRRACERAPARHRGDDSRCPVVTASRRPVLIRSAERDPARRHSHGLRRVRGCRSCRGGRGDRFLRTGCAYLWCNLGDALEVLHRNHLRGTLEP